MSVFHQIDGAAENPSVNDGSGFRFRNSWESFSNQIHGPKATDEFEGFGFRAHETPAISSGALQAAA